MKSKKKVGLVKRIAAGVCAVMLAVGCMGTVSFYADIGAVPNDIVIWSGCAFNEDDFFEDYVYDYFYAHSQYMCFEYEGHMFIVNFSGSSRWYASGFGYQPGVGSYNAFYYDQGKWKDYCHGSSGSSFLGLVGDFESCFGYNFPFTWNSSLEDLPSDFYIYSTCNIDNYDKKEGFFLNEGWTNYVPETYNSSLGYLQDIKRQFIYLEDDAFDLVEDTAACKFTFANTTTTGLDITDGNWSIRHYMQIEVKNAKKEYETVEVYDKVYLNEYPAADGKIIYQQKDTIQRLHEESSFDGLSWWESNFLGYITYYNDYFQLVRTNEDGSVEYGGYVKVWQDEYNINHSITLDENENPDDSGYNDNIVSGSHGSGSTYEEAEKDADENAANASNDSDDMLDSLNDIVSTVMAVPQIFAKMFSFLPDWCLNLFGASVGLAGIILVWKVARG